MPNPSLAERHGYPGDIVEEDVGSKIVPGVRTTGTSSSSSSTAEPAVAMSAELLEEEPSFEMSASVPEDARAQSQRETSPLAAGLIEIPPEDFAEQPRTLLDSALEPLAEESLAGDYIWRLADGSRESFLRLRPDGKWWHAAHQFSCEDAASDGWASLLMGGQDPNPDGMWETAEALGSWLQVPIPADLVGRDEESGPGRGVLLFCENFRWTTTPTRPHKAATGAVPARHNCGGGSASSLRPTLQEKTDMDSAVVDGLVVFCYIESETDGIPGCLELQYTWRCGLEGEELEYDRAVDEARIRALEAAVRSLGLARYYGGEEDDDEYNGAADDDYVVHPPPAVHSYTGF